MIDRERIAKAIFQAVDEVNQIFPKELRLKKSSETVLFGKKESLDSLGFVNLIVAVEHKIEEEFGIIITLADERAMSQNDSPFNTLGTLSDYISLLLEEKTTNLSENKNGQ